MSESELLKEKLNNLRVYLTICIAVLIAVASGISKLYLSNNISLLFWIGFILFEMFILFSFILILMIENRVRS